MGGLKRWADDRHQEAVAAFYEALSCRPDYYEAKLYKGVALTQSASIEELRLRTASGAVSSLSKAAHETLCLNRMKGDIGRAREALEAALRLRPSEGQALFELIKLYSGIGLREQAQQFLDRLHTVDLIWWERAQAEFGDDLTA